MKKHLKYIVLTVLFLLIVVYFSPRSIGKKMDGADFVLVSWGGGFSEKERIELRVERGSDDFEKLNEILNKYSYHATLHTIFRNTLIQGVIEDRVSIKIGNNRKGGIIDLESVGRKETRVNSTAYDIGYFNDEKAIEFMTDMEYFVEHSNSKIETE